MNRRVVRIILPAILTIAGEQAIFVEKAYTITYLSVEQAQQILAPQVIWSQITVTLNDKQIEVIEDLSGVSVLNPELKVWRSPNGDFFVVDNVMGKHEFITYAVLLSGEGQLKGLEILDYRETYGDQIRRPEWRAQFIGKSNADEIVFEENILNISGATISCSQITKGVKKVLATFKTVLNTYNHQ